MDILLKDLEPTIFQILASKLVGSPHFKTDESVITMSLINLPQLVIYLGRLFT